MAALRDASELVWPAVEETLERLELKPEDAAAARLVQQYAKVIDSQNGHCRGCEDPDCHRTQGSSWAMRWLAPLLLDALNALGATPAARAALTKKGGPAESAEDPLAKLRSRRRGA